MSTFADIIVDTPVVLTENGALSNATTNSGRVDLFFKLVRDISPLNLEPLLEAAWRESPVDTVKILFHSRDARGGKGERQLFQHFFDWLLKSAERIPIAIRLCQYIPEYGRWDDLIRLIRHKELGSECFRIISERIQRDLETEDNAPISLLAKWLPTEKKALDRELKFVNWFCKRARVSRMEYRKNIITPLRSQLKLVETHLTEGEFHKINYSHVPSCAMAKYSKTFEKRDGERYRTWLAEVKLGTAKVNAGQLYPHQIVKKYLDQVRSTTIEVDDLLEAQWQVMQSQVTGTLTNCIWLADMSGSMSGEPMLVAMALSLLCSGLTTPPFKDLVMTFSAKPTFYKIEGETLARRVHDMYRKMCNDWGSNTDLQAVFSLILRRATDAGLSAEQMPNTVFILSDMQFDMAIGSGGYVTNHQAIEEKYAAAGYPMPRIVYWNLRANTNDTPVASATHPGVALLSGFSTSVLKSLMNGADFTPYSTLRQTIDVDRYQILETAFQ